MIEPGPENVDLFRLRNHQQEPYFSSIHGVTQLQAHRLQIPVSIFYPSFILILLGGFLLGKQ